jgi:hypothetical protein
MSSAISFTGSREYIRSGHVDGEASELSVLGATTSKWSSEALDELSTNQETPHDCHLMKPRGGGVEAAFSAVMEGPVHRHENRHG